MNIGIIGARKSRNGIGEYIGKFFHQHGAHVVCVLGTTIETAAEASEALKRYGISARQYGNFADMAAEEDLDAVVIASPPQTHLPYLKACIDNGLSVFCEKPFLDPGSEETGDTLTELFRLSRQKEAVIAMNSQWPFCLPSYEQLCGRIDRAGAGRFSMRLSPLCTGADMIPDSVPHCLSLLYSALGKGEIAEILFDEGPGRMDIRFAYVSRNLPCEVSLSLVQERTQPRTMSFGFNDRIAERIIDTATYGIRLSSGGNEMPVPDPLELSVRDFIDACTSGREPMIGQDHIIATTMLLKQIYDAYVRLERG